VSHSGSLCAFPFSHSIRCHISARPLRGAFTPSMPFQILASLAIKDIINLFSLAPWLTFIITRSCTGVR
jgi:hypothetical protein